MRTLSVAPWPPGAVDTSRRDFIACYDEVADSDVSQHEKKTKTYPSVAKRGKRRYTERRREGKVRQGRGTVSGRASGGGDCRSKTER